MVPKKTYNAAGQPVSAGGIWSYVGSLSYDELGRPQQYSLGSSSEPAYVTNSYDPQTNALAEQQTSTGTTPSVIDDLKYAYDNIGSVLSENDQPAGGPAQSRCFQYDYLGRLATAWSQGSACTASSSPSTSAEGGAAAPYWKTFTYDTTGNLTKQTSEQPDGTVTTTTGAFPAPGSAQPHAPASETQSGGSTGTTSYSYDTAGHLTSSSSNTVTGTIQSQSLAWDDAGRLSSITSPSGGVTPSTKYFYDAGGNLLIEADPGQSTLFLPDEQLVQNTVTGIVSGTRYYTIGGSGTSTSSGPAGNASASADSSTSGSAGGGTTASSAAGSSGGSSAGKAAAGGIGSGGATVACRTSSGTVDYLIGDQQGTAGLAIDASNLQVTRRYYDPYGNQVGTPPSSWPGNKGFVGGTDSKATGLTNLGAREYQPQTETFITPDSLLNPYDPQNLNAYAYASDNPATESDPTGQTACDAGYCPTAAGPVVTPSRSGGSEGRRSDYAAIAALLGIPAGLLFPEPARPATISVAHCNPMGCISSESYAYNNPNTPFSLGVAYGAGLGNRNQYFNQWDPMTQELAHDPAIAELTALIKSKYLPRDQYYGSVTYKDPANVGSYFQDIPLNYFLGLHSGSGSLKSPGAGSRNVSKSPIDGFLGSYAIKWAAVPTGRRAAKLFFTVTNDTDTNSLTHLNGILGRSLDNSTGMFATVHQEFQWQT